MLFSLREDSDQGGRRGLGQGQTMAAAVSAKLEEGNIRAAARILCSDDKPVPINETTLEELKLKHPCPPGDRPPIPEPPVTTPYQVSEAEVLTCIRSFPAGSSGGPDGIRPQHVWELVSQTDTGPGLLTAIPALVNLLLAGSCPLSDPCLPLWWHSLCLAQEHRGSSPNSHWLLLAQTGG